MNYVKYGTETITFCEAKIWKICLMIARSQYPYQCLNLKLKCPCILCKTDIKLVGFT